MIFATVGTQLPFPRLMQALNDLAPKLSDPIIAQTGTEPQDWPNLDQRQSLAPQEFSALFNGARVIVAHAGIGTILSAKRWCKPLILLPREHALGEHRNDHQYATMARFQARSGIFAVEDGDALSAQLDHLTRADQQAEAGNGVSPYAEDRLIQRLNAFIHDG